MAKKTLPKRRSAGGRFAVPGLSVVLAGSAHKRPGDHVVGRIPAIYLLPPLGNVHANFAIPSGAFAVDAIAKRLGLNDVLVLRRAVVAAHNAGVDKLVEFIDRDSVSRAIASLRALRALLPVVRDSTFIPAIQNVASIVAAENPSFGDHARDLARGLEHVMLLKSIVADEQRRAKPVKRKNPGKPYMAGLAESLVASWHEWTGEFPSKTRVSARRSKSLRVLFWDFADAARADLGLRDQPIDYQVRSAIAHLQKAGKHPPK